MHKRKNRQPNKLSLLIKNVLRTVCYTALFVSPVYAVEFNTDMIDAEDRSNIDISQFEKKGYISPGKYLVRVNVNKNMLPKAWTLEWIKADTESGSQLCLTKQALADFGLAPDFIARLSDLKGMECVDLSHTPELSSSLDKSTMVVTLAVPQAWMKYQAKNWTPPEYWDEGIAGLILDYNLYASQYNPNDGDSTQNLSSYGTLGFNLGAWRLRSDYQYSQYFTNGHSTSHDSSLARTYLYRPIPALSSKFTMGQYDLSSDLYDTFHFTGASLESDDSMLPPDLQGYAPQVTGIAQTNAKVTVSQSGRVLYQTTVPPGPFTISDLGQSFQGQLDVTVEEEDGRKSTFQVGSATIPFLTRKGQVRYKTSTGKPTSVGHNDVNNPFFWTGEASWGWLNDVSLYGGGMFTADDYQAATAGVGFNLNAFGSLSFDVTSAQANLRQDNSNTQRGYSYRANYAKRFESTGSQVTFAGYRFSDKEYVSMSEYLSSRNGDDSTSNEKESYVASLSQYIDALALNAYINITRNTYWDSSSTTNYSLSLSHNFDIGDFKGISASLAISRARWDNDEENQYYFSLSLPLQQNRNITYSMQQTGGGDTSHMASYYDSSDRNNTWNLSASATQDDISNGEPSLRGNYQHYSPYGRLNLNGSVQPSQYRSITAGWNGSFTATRHGMALHDYSPGDNARMMVDADGVSGVEVNSNRTVTNAMGIAVIPSLSNYTTATVRVNANNLPDGVDVDNSVIRTTLTQGAIGYAKLNATTGYQIIGVIRREDGRFPPLGVSVEDKASGKETGLVAEDGFVYLSGIQENSTLRLKWGDQVCEVTPPNQSNIGSSAIILPCKTVH
ncbi:fimbria/pilus outer membrane usher protein [[Enterobacter] lignolyticus]|uniref:Fimbrial biogenesis outer membrane usher protein n=1 Tax=Enterobacter lignolyticus (strain SCF1) TaxID=701347 RepID=E3G3B0_ENTLS|nr:fimbria/pilus outer membrane usher protein [[Enterobacter] lignolyticus]ADO46987.1 fimbrial biogenesis outer membrane usher protein [[Enterobacter] lignolyticus SCF1]